MSQYTTKTVRSSYYKPYIKVASDRKMLFKWFVYFGSHPVRYLMFMWNKGGVRCFFGATYWKQSPLNRRFELRSRKKTTSALIPRILIRKEDTFVISCIPRKARDWGEASVVRTSFLWSSLLTTSLPLLADFQAWHRCLRRTKASLQLSWLVYIRVWIVCLAEEPWTEVESGWKDWKPNNAIQTTGSVIITFVSPTVVAIYKTFR